MPLLDAQKARWRARANLNRMSVAVWRVLVLLAAAAVGLGVIAAAFALPIHGDVGYETVPVPNDPQFRSRVVSVARYGPAAGLVLPGDLVGLADLSVRERSIYFAKRPGTVLDLGVDRGRRHFVVSVRVRDRGETRSGMLLGATYLAVAVAFASVAVLIALRAPGVAEARSLANFFISYAASICVASLSPFLSWQLFAAGQIISVVLLLYGFTEAARFSTLFPTPATTGWRAGFRRSLRFMFAAGLVLNVLTIAVAGSAQELHRLYVSAMIVWWVIMSAAVAASLVIGGRGATGTDAQRVRWVSLSIVLGFSGIVVTVALQAAGNRSGAAEVLPLTLIVIPIGVTYAILRHRLLDIGFVINRALVFGIVSGVVVLAFAILEFVIGRYVLALGHVTSTSLELGLALGLGFSLRYIHTRAERIVADLFFRERRRAEAELRRFARQTAFFTDANALIARSVEIVEQRMRLTGAAIVVPSADEGYRTAASTLGAPAAFNADDPALVALRAEPEPVSLRGSGSEIPGEIAFPCRVRNELVAALVCGAKCDGDEFAPDENDVLEELAHELGVALEALDVAALRREVARVIEGNGSLRDLARASGAGRRKGDEPLPATGGP